jgi:integrase/recombinase XerD
MNDETAITIYTGSMSVEPTYQDIIPSLDQALDDWIVESARSKSDRTSDIYRNTITQFRIRLQSKGLDLDGHPVAVRTIAREWLNEREVSWATFNQRRSILSSWFKYAIRNDVLAYNPIESIRLREKGAKDTAHHLPDSQVKMIMASIDRSTVEGLRDYALLSVAFTAGHRAGELAGLRLKHLTFQDGTCVVEWERCKGGKHMTSRLEKGTTKALYAYLTDARVYGNRLLTMPGDSPVWLSFSDRNAHQAIGMRTIGNICERHLKTGKSHTTRHTAAVNMSKQKASLEQIRQFLGHSNAKTTSDYLEEQLGYVNPFAEQLEAAFGIE